MTKTNFDDEIISLTVPTGRHICCNSAVGLEKTRPLLVTRTDVV